MNLGGEHPGNTGKTLINTGSSVLIPGDAPVSRLQNLSNYPARAGLVGRSNRYGNHQTSKSRILRAGYPGNDPAFCVLCLGTGGALKLGFVLLEKLRQPEKAMFAQRAIPSPTIKSWIAVGNQSNDCEYRGQ